MVVTADKHKPNTNELDRQKVERDSSKLAAYAAPHCNSTRINR